MLMRRLLLLTVLTIIIGCTSDKFHSVMRTNPAPISKFIPKPKLLVKQPDTFPFHYFYLNPKAKHYKNIYIAPVNIDHIKKSSAWGELDRKLAGSVGNDMKELQQYMRKAYIWAFERDLKIPTQLNVVNRRDLPNTLVLSSAIIMITPTKAELNTLATIGSFVNPLISAASLFGDGAINVECVIRDSRTNEIMAMYADTECDPHALFNSAGWTWTMAARINIKDIALNTAKLMATRDHKKIRRDFPIQWVSLIHDAEIKD